MTILFWIFGSVCFCLAWGLFFDLRHGFFSAVDSLAEIAKSLDEPKKRTKK